MATPGNSPPNTINISVDKIIVTCHSSKQQIWGHSGIGRCSCPPPAPNMYPLGGFRMEQTRMMALDSKDAHQRDAFNEPRLLHLPIHIKVLKSLTCDVWILWLAQSFDVQLYIFFSKNSHVSWLLLYLFRTDRVHSEAASWVTVLKAVPDET